VSATSGNAQATVTWTAPASNGGGAITGYAVTASPGGQTASVVGTVTTATVTGLSNGNSYSFTVTATNAAGTGPASTASNVVTLATVPGAPTAVTAAAGNAQATVSWTAPSSNGGSAITGYTVTATPGGQTATVSGSVTIATVSGLTNGTAYTFTVRATNAAGTGSASAASAASAAVTPATAPGAPTGVTATAGNGHATVSWTAPSSNGGTAITAYSVTSSPGGIIASTSGAMTVAVTGLTNGTAYTFTLMATNAAGTGPASPASNSVTPVATCPVAGATDIWTGSAGTSNWTDAGNWSTLAPPGANDFACLPANTAGTQSISVPAGTLRQLVSYKSLTLANGITTTAGADFEANVAWTAGAFAGPTVTIGAGATVTVSGVVSLVGTVTVSNGGTVRLMDGASLSGTTGTCGSSNLASWLNGGTLVFADTNGVSVSLNCGRLVNLSGGTVVKSGSAGYDSLTGSGQIENDGTVTSQAGILLWAGGSSLPSQLSPGSGVSTGSFGTSGSGHVDLGYGYGAGSAVPVSSQTTFVGSGVWVTGTLTGTVVVPSGSVLNVGTDGSPPSWRRRTRDCPRRRCQRPGRTGNR
jgi:hypothetical protein